MIIREADLDIDALAITEGAHKFAKKMALGHLVADDFMVPFSKIATLDGAKIIVAEHKGNVVGGIGMYIAPYIWNNSLFVADELFWWVDEGAPFRTAKLLFDEAMKEADKKNAIPMFKALQDSPDGVDKIYRKHNMKPIETVYTRASLWQ